MCTVGEEISSDRADEAAYCCIFSYPSYPSVPVYQKLFDLFRCSYRADHFICFNYKSLKFVCLNFLPGCVLSQYILPNSAAGFWSIW